MNEDIDVDALLDGTLDDLADLPEFKPYVPGAHQALATFSLKEISGHKGKTPELAFKYVELRELSDPQDEPPQPGDEANCLYFLDNEIGQGKFKEVIAAFGIGLDMVGSTNRQIMEAVQDVEVVILSGVSEKGDRTFLDIKELAVV